MTNAGLGFARVVDEGKVFLGSVCIVDFEGEDSPREWAECVAGNINRALQKHFVPVELADKLAETLKAIGCQYIDQCADNKSFKQCLRCEARSAYQNRGRGRP